MTLEEIKKEAQNKMDKANLSLQSNLAKIRTGRAHTSLLEDIKVNYYGTPTPLSQVASITVSDARTLTISPWEKNLIKDIEKAILECDLGLNPVGLGTSLKIPMPALTEERRKELTKVVKNDVENAKISVRSIRRDANSAIKKSLKDKIITKDEEKKAEEQIQKITDEHVKKMDVLCAIKEKELLEI